jgi:hypothetical protein
VNSLTNFNESPAGDNSDLSTKTSLSRESQVIRLGKIKSNMKLLAAFRHNLREIQKELGADSHIDSKKSSNNILLRGGQTSNSCFDTYKSLLKTAGITTLRKDAVLCVEYLFALSANTSISIDDYFEESVQWLENYTGCRVLSAVIHLDENAPHMHVLLMPLRDGRMQGSKLAGNRQTIHALKRDHFEKVAKNFGLQQSISLSNQDKNQVAALAYGIILQSPDLLKNPDVKHALLRVIANDPVMLQQSLCIEISPKPKKLRTLTQTMTSKGKGSRNYSWKQ